MIDRRLATALLAATLVVGVAVGADGDRIGQDGVVHSAWNALGSSGGMAIEYVRQLPSGEIRTEFVDGTDDYPSDRDPMLELSEDGEPIVAWIRNEGEGPQLYGSRRTAVGWTQPTPWFPGPKEKHVPDMTVSGDWVNVTWREASPNGALFYRGVIDPLTLEPVFGPEAMPKGEDVPPVLPEGESMPGTTPEPPGGGTSYFAALLPPMVPGDPSTVIVWGIQDEPIPIDYCQRFTVPDGVRNARQVRASAIAGRLTVTFVDDDYLYYTMRRDGRWTDLRVVELDEQTDAADARLALIEMIQRDTGQY